MASDLCGKVETSIQIKAPASSFHSLITHTPHHLPNVSSDKFHAVDLHEGDWGTVGSVIYWSYSHDGKQKMAKDIIEAIDEEKNSITFRVIEGDIMEEYNSFKAILEVTTNAEAEGSTVKWTFEYEKKHNQIVDPHTLLDFAVEVSKELDDHLLEAINK